MQSYVKNLTRKISKISKVAGPGLSQKLDSFSQDTGGYVLHVEM